MTIPAGEIIGVTQVVTDPANPLNVVGSFGPGTLDVNIVDPCRTWIQSTAGESADTNIKLNAFRLARSLDRIIYVPFNNATKIGLYADIEAYRVANATTQFQNEIQIFYDPVGLDWNAFGTYTIS